jgi:hypothetical protein
VDEQVARVAGGTAASGKPRADEPTADGVPADPAALEHQPGPGEPATDDAPGEDG